MGIKRTRQTKHPNPSQFRSPGAQVVLPVEQGAGGGDRRRGEERRAEGGDEREEEEEGVATHFCFWIG